MKRNKFWHKFTEDMMMNSKTSKEFSYWGKMRNLELKCELENWNLFDCTETGKITPMNTYYTTKEMKK